MPLALQDVLLTRSLFNRSGFTKLYILTALILAVAFSCKKPTEPPPNGGPDTTSHNWTFTTDTLGEFGSYLRDVIILSEDNAWAVGEIYRRDTLYNAAHWNGTAWTFVRVMFRLDYGTTVILTDQIPIYSVFAPAPNDIWFVSSVGGVTRLMNTTWTMMNFLLADGPGRAKMWGTGSSNMYFVSAAGRITRFNGSNWQRLESNTTVDLLDVWGSPDGSVMWACGYKDFVGTVLLKITGTTVEKVYDDNDNWFRIRQDSLSGVLTSVWTNSSDKLYVITPAGLYECPATTRGQAKRIWFNNTYVPGFPNGLRGQAANDIVAVGDFHMISHYNGNTVRYYGDLYRRVRLRSVAVKGDILVGIGADHDRSIAAIVWGRRE